MMQINDLDGSTHIKLQFDVVKPMCRCCLSTDRRMIKAAVYDLLFNDLAGINVSESDGLPQWLCWECCALLRKAVRFKQKMLRAHTLLYEYSHRCAPFPIDTEDNELARYASPQLCMSEILVFELADENDTNYQETMEDTEIPLDNLIPELPEDTAEVKNEFDNFSDYDYEDNVALIEYKSKLLDDDLKRLLENPEGNIVSTIKTKRKKKKKEDKVKKKKKKNSDEQTDMEPPKKRKSSIRKSLEIDPEKIRTINLNPEEQIREREEESQFPYKCNLCYKGFNYETKLENHMKKHSPSRGSYECKLCHMYLPTSYSFNVHMLIHTTRYECRQCGRRMIDRSSILDHYRSQHEGMLKQYTCEICGKVSNNNKTHRGHMRNHHSGVRPKCDQCGKTFVNKDGLTEHILIHQGIKNYACDTCGAQFRTRTQIKLHQLVHSDAKEFYCVECDVRFKTSYSLRQHLLKSLKHKDLQSFKYPCPRCPKRFESAAGLRSHALIQHEGVRAHRCAACPAALASRASLLKHQRSVHAGQRPQPKHVCHTCGKTFRGKSVLVNHVRTHTGEKPFSCQECGRGFAQRTAMRTHVRLVHKKLPRQVKPKPESHPAPEPKVFVKQDEWGRADTSDIYYHAPAL